MNIQAIVSVWNGAVWMESALKWMTPFFNGVHIQEANWCSDDTRWAASTSPDGTADIIRRFKDENDKDDKIKFYQLGKWEHGCLAARSELCSRIPRCDWVWVCDVDEFYMRKYLRFVASNLRDLTKQGYTTVSQHSRSFYWDMNQHTTEGFTRLWKWYSGIDCWHAHYPIGKDFNVPREFGEEIPSPTEPGMEIYHYSYVPPPAVEIKGAESFDVPRERYKEWYKDTYMKYDGNNIEDVYNSNTRGKGVHVFGGLELIPYQGEHPEVLRNHPLRHAKWNGSCYLDKNNNEIPIKGWWNQP